VEEGREKEEPLGGDHRVLLPPPPSSLPLEPPHGHSGDMDVHPEAQTQTPGPRGGSGLGLR
jgi:hypothetical protein